MNSETRKIQKNSHVKAEKWSLPSMSADHATVFRHESIQSETSAKAVDESLIPSAAEIDLLRKQAHEKGYLEGLKQAQQETDELAKRLRDFINFFEYPLQSLNEEVEQQLSLLAVTLAQQLVRREIRMEPGEIIAVIRESVKLLPGSSRKIRILLNPDDMELVRNTLQLDENEEEQSWKLIEDPMITRGGCEIKSDKSVINATLENRLQALAASILGGERIEDKEDDTAVD